MQLTEATAKRKYHGPHIKMNIVLKEKPGIVAFHMPVAVTSSEDYPVTFVKFHIAIAHATQYFKAVRVGGLFIIPHPPFKKVTIDGVLRAKTFYLPAAYDGEVIAEGVAGVQGYIGGAQGGFNGNISLLLKYGHKQCVGAVNRGAGRKNPYEQ